MAEVEITDTALVDFCRFFGRELGEAARSELEAEFKKAVFKKSAGGGGEIWRSGRPLRVQFVVFPQTDGKLVVGSVARPYRGAEVRPRVRKVSVKTDDGVVRFTAADMVLEPGPERRVAYRKLAEEGAPVWSTWLWGRRGARLDEVVGGLMETLDPPDWVLPFIE